MAQAAQIWQGWNDVNDHIHLDVLQAFEEERQPGRHIRRIVADRMNPFIAMTDEEFIGRFRLRKESIHTIIQDIQDHLPAANDLRGKIIFQRLFMD